MEQLSPADVCRVKRMSTHIPRHDKLGLRELVPPAILYANISVYYKDITSGSFVYRPTQSLLYFPDVQSKCSFSKCGCCGHQTVPLETPVQVRPFGLTMAEMAIIDHFRQHTKRLYEFIKGRPSVGYLNMYNISLLELHLRSLESIHAI